VANQTFPGVLISATSPINVGPNSRTTFTLEFTMDPSVGPPDDAFFSQTEVDGWFVLDDGTDALRVVIWRSWTRRRGCEPIATIEKVRKCWPVLSKGQGKHEKVFLFFLSSS
jgi:hypothetical protein